MPIDVVAYDREWPERFLAVRAALQRALEEIPVVALEHIGSTSVPGLAAKPVSDIDVVVALERIGCQHRGDLGIPDRHSLAAPNDGTGGASTSLRTARSPCATISPSATPSGRIARSGRGTGHSSVGCHRNR